MENNIEETEEQKKDRIRKEILDDLNNNSYKNNGNINGEIQSFGPPKKRSKVSFNKDDEKKINSKDENITKTSSSNGGSNKFLLLICSIIVIISIFFFPKISKAIEKYRNSKVKTTVDVEEVKEKEYPKLTLESEETSNLKYPIMHVDNSVKTTYHSKESVKVSDFSNNDILYNALADAYEGNMAKYTGSYNGNYCGSSANKVSINARYLKLRIENLYNRKTNYTLSDFVVPVTSTKSKYVGTWKYNQASDAYIYYGDCSKTTIPNVLYYDIRVPYEANSSDKNIELYVYNYLAFAMVNKTNNTYIIYSDANYTKELSRGTLTTNDYETELTNIVKNTNKDNMNKYKYTFSIVDCAYQDYCFVSGEWIK